jgi:hypothetical protein
LFHMQIEYVQLATTLFFPVVDEPTARLSYQPYSCIDLELSHHLVLPESAEKCRKKKLLKCHLLRQKAK